MIGQTISHYQILKKLGAGGMGVVYKAQDTKLNRTVALKFLPQDLTREQEAIDRFINEAQAASRLDHPNICTIHEINETEDGQMFICMAYYGGETLEKKITRGQLSVDSVIDIAMQVALGLERAHESGIIHRDIKPSNLIITPRQEVKIIDFGLAKLAGLAKLTKSGSTPGTVAYMSPEQVSRPSGIDQRTDIWSLGVVLYEMLTGELPFRGENEAAVIYSIVSEEPEPLARYRTEVPEGLQNILDKALARTPEARYQQIGDLLTDLVAVRQGATELVKPVIKPKSRAVNPAKRAFITITVFAAALIVLLYLFVLQPSPTIPPTHRQVTFTGDASFPAISPDGQFIAYVTGKSGEQKVMVQDMAGGEPLNIYQAKGCRDLRWSPDGTELVVHGDSAGEAILIPRLGGRFRSIPSFDFLCWSSDGSQIASTFSNSKVIQITSKSTAERAVLFLYGSFNWLHGTDWSPLGNRLLFLIQDPKGYAIWTIKIDGSQQQKVVEDSLALFSPRWSGDGKAIYYLRSEGQAQSLMKVSIALKSGKANGPAINLLVGFPFGEYFTLSADNKRLLYTRETQSSNLWLITFKGDGKTQAFATKQLTTGTSWAHDPAISPDGSKIEFSVGTRPRANLFVMPIAGGPMQQLTFLNSYNAGAAWSPDGKEITFGSTQDGKPKAWRIKSNGGTPRPFMKTELSEDTFLLTWSPGANILYQRPGNQIYHILNPQTEEETPLLETPPTDGYILSPPRYSPDTKSVAVYWSRLLAGKRVAGIWLVSLENSSQFLLYRGDVYPIKWSANGKWIYAWDFLKKPTEILKIPIAGGQPQTAIALPFENLHDETKIDMSADERQIACPVMEKQSDVWMVENCDPANELEKPVEAPTLPEMKQLTYLQNGCELFFKQKKYSEAEKAFRQGLELNPKHLSLLYYLGLSLKNQRKLVEAEAALRQGLEIAPEHPYTLEDLRATTFANKNYSAAKRYNEKYLEIIWDQGAKLRTYVSLVLQREI